MTEVRKLRKDGRPELTPEQKIKRAAERKPVRGKFIFHEVPGGKMDFNFRGYEVALPEDPIEKYEMMDGEIATVPLAVAKHLNTNCWYPTYTYANDEYGRPNMKMGQKVRRCSFQSLEFVDYENGKQIGSALSNAEQL